MGTTEQLTAGPVWSDDTLIVSSIETAGMAVPDQDASGSVCRTIELFRADVPRTAAPRPKKRTKGVTFTEGLAILMLTAATCIALFAAIGYLCR